MTSPAFELLRVQTLQSSSAPLFLCPSSNLSVNIGSTFKMIRLCLQPDTAQPHLPTGPSHQLLIVNCAPPIPTVCSPHTARETLLTSKSDHGHPPVRTLPGLHLIQGKGQILTVAHKIPHHLAPFYSPSCSLCSSHTGLLTVTPKGQAYSCLRAFALAGSSVLEHSSLNFHMAHSLISLRALHTCHLFSEALPEDII